MTDDGFWINVWRNQTLLWWEECCSTFVTVLAKSLYFVTWNTSRTAHNDDWVIKLIQTRSSIKYKLMMIWHLVDSCLSSFFLFLRRVTEAWCLSQHAVSGEQVNNLNVFPVRLNAGRQKHATINVGPESTLHSMCYWKETHRKPAWTRR